MLYTHSYFWANEFLQSYHSLFVISLFLKSESKTIVVGNGVNTSAYKCLEAAVGEFYEREFLFEFNRYYDKKKLITGINMQSGQPVFLKKEEIDKNGWFKDSCGLATHIWSKECIANSFNEFVERQSFVFSYLSKKPAKKIRAEIYSRYIDIPDVLKNIKVYNISLSSQFYVILMIADIENKVWLGLGADCIFSNALQKALRETYQCLLVKKCEVYNNTTISRDSSLNSYSRMFEFLTGDQVRNAYLYLENSEEMMQSEVRNERVPIKDVLQELSTKYGISPYIFFVNFKNSNIKGCFVCDLNWFPSMFPRNFIKKHYDYVENMTKVKLNRNCTYIPFP